MEEKDNIKKLIEERKKVKGKKPRFIRKDSYKRSRLGKRRKKKVKWRRPRGKHSQVRTKRKGYIIQPSIGWGSPKKVRGFFREKTVRTIHTLKEMEKISSGENIFLAHIGKKLKIEFLKKAQEKGIKILNLKADKYFKKPKEEVKTEIKK